MTHRFTSLRHSVEKLQEAEYFLAGLVAANGLEFQFNLNAFLSASRSATFTLQKSMATVSGFDTWYENKRREMKADPALGFFLELRNISQHEGPVSYVGGSLLGTSRWTYRFAGNREAVPKCLLGVDVGAACADHLKKLATLVQEAAERFSFASCPATAVSPEGMAALGYSLDDVGNALGLPGSFLDAGAEIPVAVKLRLLSREFEPLDVDTLNRLGRGDFRRGEDKVAAHQTQGTDLPDLMAEMIERGSPGPFAPRDVFLAAIAKRVTRQEQ